MRRFCEYLEVEYALKGSQSQRNSVKSADLYRKDSPERNITIMFFAHKMITYMFKFQFSAEIYQNLVCFTG